MMDFEDALKSLTGSKFEKRKTLENLSVVISSPLKSEQIQKLIPCLISILSDESEMNRTMACNHLLSFADSTLLEPKILCALMTMIHHRIGKLPVHESSEDVHCLLISLMKKSIEKQDVKLMEPYLNEIINVCKTSLLEKSPELLMEAMNASSILLMKMQDIFHLQSESLVMPLLKLLKHQRFKIRVKVVDLLGHIAIYGNIGDLKDITLALEQSMIDLTQVKLALLDFGMLLASKMKDRYSFWPQILPFILFGLRDENPEVINKSESYWRQVGVQYETENEKELKEKIDFQYENHFPVGECKFGIGCQELVKRSLHSILKKMKSDIQNWKEKYRMCAIKLLTSLILSGKSTIIQYTTEIIEYIFFTAGDDNEHICKQAHVCAKYMAYFIPPNAYVPCLENEHKYRCRNFYTVLRYVIEGTALCDLQAVLPSVIGFLGWDKLDAVDDVENLVVILEICVQAKPPDELQSRLVESLLYLESQDGRAKDVINKLVSLKDIQSKENLVSDAMESIFTRLMKTACIWVEDSPEFTVAQSLIGSPGSEDHFDTILSLLKLGFRPSEAPVVAYKLIESVRLKVHSCSKMDSNLEVFCANLIKEFLNELLPWKAGKTAEALRTVSISCLLTIAGCSNDQPLIFDALAVTLKLLPSLTTDDCEVNRVLMCNMIRTLSTKMRKLLSVDTYFLFTKVLVERLEDKSDAVRLAAAEGIRSTFVMDSVSWCQNTQQIEYIIESLFIYADDSHDRVSSLVIDALKVLSEILPDKINQLVRENETLFRNRSSLEDLSDHIVQLQIS